MKFGTAERETFTYNPSGGVDKFPLFNILITIDGSIWKDELFNWESLYPYEEYRDWSELKIEFEEIENKANYDVSFSYYNRITMKNSIMMKNKTKHSLIVKREEFYGEVEFNTLLYNSKERDIVQKYKIQEFKKFSLRLDESDSISSGNGDVRFENFKTSDIKFLNEIKDNLIGIHHHSDEPTLYLNSGIEGVKNLLHEKSARKRKFKDISELINSFISLIAKLSVYIELLRDNRRLLRFDDLSTIDEMSNDVDLKLICELTKTISKKSGYNLNSNNSKDVLDVVYYLLNDSKSSLPLDLKLSELIFFDEVNNHISKDLKKFIRNNEEEI